MTKRNSKTVAQQCRYYEVDNIFVYMVETYINGNFETFRRLYHELNKDARRDFMDFLLSEVEPTYWRAVSYTHLDVYKRQALYGPAQQPGTCRQENG